MHEIQVRSSYKTRNICNLIVWNSAHISNIFNCYSENVTEYEEQEN